MVKEKASLTVPKSGVGVDWSGESRSALCPQVQPDNQLAQDLYFYIDRQSDARGRSLGALTSKCFCF